MEYSYKTLKVTVDNANAVALVSINRPKQLNAMNKQFWPECAKCFSTLHADSRVRAIVVNGTGKHFSAGLDLQDAVSMFMPGEQKEQLDTARKAWKLHDDVHEMQDAFNAIEKCRKPVIAAITGACIGGGVDMIASCDIRLASEKTAIFSIKEVDIGLAADLGSLQRLTKIVGHHSWLREVAFTGRRFNAAEAHRVGLVSAVYENDEKLMEGAMKLAKEIAAKSPVAISGTKVALNYARDHTVENGLKQIIYWNMSMLQTEDVPNAVQATLSKSKPTFSKL
jgi:delta(3,5)-delta(2,4)-dienoyl-CoA isomerase